MTRGKRLDGLRPARSFRVNQKGLYWRHGTFIEDGTDILFPGDPIFPNGRKLSDILRAMYVAIGEGHRVEFMLGVSMSPKENSPS